MKKASIAGAIALSTIGIAVVAHNGATGVVLDRMNGMSAMRDVMRDLAPMMQGQAPYDVRTVQTGAATLMAHSGNNMNRLFPQEPIPAASFARPQIWDDWEAFDALSEELRTYALGLATAAQNGLTAPLASDAGGDVALTMDHSTMQMAPEAAPEGFTVAELMGVVPKTSIRPAAPVARLDGGIATAQMVPVETLVTEIDFSTMAAPRAFEMVGQTCAACHSQFRNGS